MIATNFNVREFPTVQSVMQSLDERFPADRRQFARRKGLELLRLLLFVLGSCLQIAGKTADLLGSWMLEASRRPIAPVQVAVDTSMPDSSVETDSSVNSIKPVDLVAAVGASPLEASDTEVEVESAQVFAVEEVTETGEAVIESTDANQPETSEAVEHEMLDGIKQSEEVEIQSATSTIQPIHQVLSAHVIPSSKNKHPNRNSSR